MKKLRPTKLSDEIRQAIDSCGRSRYRIAKETGISESTLSRFMSGERGLTTKALDVLGSSLGLHITVQESPGTRQRKDYGKHQS